MQQQPPSGNGFSQPTQQQGMNIEQLAKCLAEAAVKTRRQQMAAGGGNLTQPPGSNKSTTVVELDDSAVFQSWYQYFLRLQQQDCQIESSLERRETVGQLNSQLPYKHHTIDAADRQYYSHQLNTMLAQPVANTSSSTSLGRNENLPPNAQPTDRYYHVYHGQSASSQSPCPPQCQQLHLSTTTDTNVVDFNQTTLPHAQSNLTYTAGGGNLSQTHQQQEQQMLLLVSQLLQQYSAVNAASASQHQRTDGTSLQQPASSPSSLATTSQTPVESHPVQTDTTPTGHRSQSQTPPSTPAPTEITGGDDSSLGVELLHRRIHNSNLFSFANANRRLRAMSANFVPSTASVSTTNVCIQSDTPPRVVGTNNSNLFGSNTINCMTGLQNSMRAQLHQYLHSSFLLRIVKLTDQCPLSRASSVNKEDQSTTVNGQPQSPSFATFSAQLPNLSPTSLPPLTGVSSASSSTGLRLNFSTPLTGTGPTPDDFVKAKESLSAWEVASNVPGLASIVIAAMCRTIALILEIIRTKGIGAVEIGADYLFYPFTGQLRLSRLLSNDQQTSASLDNIYSHSNGQQHYNDLLDSSSSNTTSHPIGQTGENSQVLVHSPNGSLWLEMMAPITTASMTQQHHNAIAITHSSESMATPPPPTQYIPTTIVQQSINQMSVPTDSLAAASISLLSTVQQLLQNRVDPTSLQPPTQPLPMDGHENVRTIWSHPHCSPVSSATNSASRTSSAQTSSNVRPASLSAPLQHPPSEQPPHLPLYPITASAPIHSHNHLTSRSPPQTADNSATNIMQIESVIYEVATRLHLNPELPLVVMPRSVRAPSPSTSPGQCHADHQRPSSECAHLLLHSPLVFQLPNPHTAFVGLPCCEGEQQSPRVVTAPTKSSMLILPTDPSDHHPRSQPLILTGPKPGHVLVVTPDNKFHYIAYNPSSPGV